MCPDSEKEPHGVRWADCAGMKVLKMGWKTPTYIYTYIHIHTRQVLNPIPIIIDIATLQKPIVIGSADVGQQKDYCYSYRQK